MDCGNGSRSRRFAISAFMRSRLNFDAPFVDLLASILEHGENTRAEKKEGHRYYYVLWNANDMG